MSSELLVQLLIGIPSIIGAVAAAYASIMASRRAGAVRNDVSAVHTEVSMMKAEVRDVGSDVKRVDTKVGEVERTFNSKMDTALAAPKELGRLEGAEAERTAEIARQATRAQGAADERTAAEGRPSTQSEKPRQS